VHATVCVPMVTAGVVFAGWLVPVSRSWPVFGVVRLVELLHE
jgi:hypothetical protein